MNRYFARMMLLVMLGWTAVACSHGSVVQPTAQSQVMPDNYSRVAVDTMSALAAYFPDQTSMAVFASYGSVVETIRALDHWNVVDANALHQTLSDLGTHYRLDPSRLKSFYEAGFHTAKGWGLGLLGRHVVLALQTDDSDKVLAWINHVVTEEFGRPETVHEKSDGWQFYHVRAMDKAIVTVMQKDGMTLMMWNGDTQKAAMELVRAIADGRTLDKVIDGEALKRNFRTASVLAVIPEKAALPDFVLPENLRQWGEAIAKSAVLGVTLNEETASVRLAMTLHADHPMVADLQSLEGGTLGVWTKPILHTEPQVAARAKINPEALIRLALKQAPVSYQDQWKALMSKLNNRLLGIHFEQQVVQNFAGSVWVALHGVREDVFQGQPWWLALLEQDVHVYLPMADAGLAAKFFGKLSFLKQFVPPDKAAIDTDDGILHAVVRFDKNIHVSYADGLLGVTTDAGWNRMKGLYASPDQKDMASNVLMDSANDLAAQGKFAPVMSLVQGICGGRCEVGDDLTHIADKFDFRVMLDGDGVVAEVGLERGR